MIDFDRARGLLGFADSILARNKKMMNLIGKSGCKMSTKTTLGVNERVEKAVNDN
jgi:hypothetical protein